MSVRLALCAVLALLHLPPVFAVDGAKLPAEKRTPSGLYLSSPEAYEMMREAPQQVLFIDVRSRAEVMFVGMPTVADANVPFLDVDELYTWDEHSNEFTMLPNEDFVPEVERRLDEKNLDKDSPVIVMCRSGGRSARAAAALHEAGFTKVYSVVDGFEGDKTRSGEYKGKRILNGWKNAGLPWTYHLDKRKMFLFGF